MPIYGSQHKALGELLSNASNNAFLLIPQLQRPYIWSPKQVTDLVDSILRGWPFGTLLLWNLGSVAQGEHLIPNRTFWIQVDQVDPEKGSKFTAATQPNEFSMVLDGQQRLQSLLLAFGPENAGFRLLDKEWRKALEGDSRHNGPATNTLSTRGSLYLDLLELEKQIDHHPILQSDLKQHPDFAQMLVWATAPEHADHPGPLPIVREPGRYIRLSRLWNLAVDKINFSQNDIAEGTLRLLEQHGVPLDAARTLFPAVCTLVKKLQGAFNQEIDYLFLNNFSKSGFQNQSDYDDAIVNIFTRLNAGGRTLTREEITFAWIKSGWNDAEKNLEDLRNEINGTDNKLRLEVDDLVRILSLAWSAVERKGAPVTNRDLMDGKTIGQMAGWLAQNWDMVDRVLKDVGGQVGALQIRYKTHYRSINALALLAIWRLIVEIWVAKNHANATDRERLLLWASDALNQGAYPWFVMSQWAGIWSSRTDDKVNRYAAELSKMHGDLTKTAGDDGIDIAVTTFNNWLAGLKKEAANGIDNLAAERTTVGVYRSALDTWNAMCGNSNRKSAALHTLRSGQARSAVKIEVDHIVSWKKWSAAAADENERSIGNSIGNCVLLTKTFNVSKSSKMLDEWLSAAGNLPGMSWDEWQSALNIDRGLVKFGDLSDANNRHRVKELILARERLIKEELKEYIRDARIVRHENKAQPAA